MSFLEIFRPVTIESYLPTFLLIFPGLISIKVSKLLFPQKDFRLSEQIIEAVFYTILNYFINIWAYFIYNFQSHTFPNFIILIWVFFLSPLSLPFIFEKLKNYKFLNRYFIINPIPKPWDYFFSKRVQCWVIIELKNGKKIGGFYGSKSFASSFPNEEQIYLEESWLIANDGSFKEKVYDSLGIIVNINEIIWIEFKKYNNEVNNGNRK